MEDLVPARLVGTALPTLPQMPNTMTTARVVLAEFHWVVSVGPVRTLLSCINKTVTVPRGVRNDNSRGADACSVPVPRCTMLKGTRRFLSMQHAVQRYRIGWLEFWPRGGGREDGCGSERLQT